MSVCVLVSIMPHRWAFKHVNCKNNNICLILTFCSCVSAACGGKVELHTERRGVIYSPSWPLNYPAGVNCSWNIQGNRGEVITIRYTHNSSFLHVIFASSKQKFVRDLQNSFATNIAMCILFSWKDLHYYSSTQ